MSTSLLVRVTELKADILTDQSTLASLRTFRQLFESSLGCHASCSFIHNSSGGHVTLTSSSARLSQAIQTSNPVLQLLISAVEYQSRCGMGNMFGALSALLIEKTLVEHCRLRPIMVGGLLDLVAADCIDYLTVDSQCLVRVSIDFDSVDCLLRLTRGVLCSSAAYGLSSADVTHVCFCIVKAFISIVPDKQHVATSSHRRGTSESMSGTCAVKTCNSANVQNDARFHNAVNSQLSVSFEDRIHCNVGASSSVEDSVHGSNFAVASQRDSVSGGTSSCSQTINDTNSSNRLNIDNISVLTVTGQLTCKSYVIDGLLVESQCFNKFASSLSTCTVILYACSLSDLNSQTTPLHSVDDVEIDQQLDIDAVLVDSLVQNISTVIARYNIDVIVCQKIMHPRVKRAIRHERPNVLILDRLGVHMVNKVHRATGAQLLSSFQSAVDGSQLGHASCVSQVTVDCKTYICLVGSRQQHCTLVLTSLTEQSVDELKSVCSVALRVLQEASHVPVALAAAGMWQRHLAEYLLEQSSNGKSEEYSRQLECTEYDAVLGIQCIASCLQRLASLLDSNVAGDVLDHTVPSVNALRSAFSLARSVLNIQHFLQCTAS